MPILPSQFGRFQQATFVVLLIAFLTPVLFGDSPVADHAIANRFRTQIEPLLNKYCLDCHNADNLESGVRVDNVDWQLEGRQPFLWTNIRKQVTEHLMPPEDEPQPTTMERELVQKWIDDALLVSKRRTSDKNGSVRRLTVSQYRNTLRDLLGIDDDLTSVLPPDAVSKDGFVNIEQTMLLSPLLIEAYFDVGEKALERCIVDELSKPVIQTFRMDFGTSINARPCPDRLILGANSHLLDNANFLVTELKPSKPFEFYPFWMKKKYRFIEGYEGNATVRGWKHYDSIYHAVFACMRGTEGYPKGNAYDVIPGGLLLRPAIPSSELFGESSTYGPKANFKISLRELPEHGNFRVRVTAARYGDGLLLDGGALAFPSEDAVQLADLSASAEANLIVEQAGIYQVDVMFVPTANLQMLALTLGDRHFAGELSSPHDKDTDSTTEVSIAFMHVRLEAGPLRMTAKQGNNQQLRRIGLTRLAEVSEAAQRFRIFERRSPIMGVYLGLRRDCGSTLAQVGDPQTVAASELHEFVYKGAISNFPSPDVEKDNVNYLAGVREIGVRSEYTDGRNMPRLLIRAVEFEGPFYDNWPPAAHRRIFIDSDLRDDPAAYAGEVIRSFAARAFRRPITVEEEQSLFAVWEEAFGRTADFNESVKDALLVVLTSPQFLFLIEHSQSPAPEPLNDFELASKLSYLLWNSPPDQQLLELAKNSELGASLDHEITRMIGHARFAEFAREFTSQWLSLDKFDVVEVDQKRYPMLTRDTKIQLRKEPIEFLNYMIRQNLPLSQFIRAEFIVANDVVANYYGLSHRADSGLDFVRLEHGDSHLGGILSHAAILAGLSNGRESNPIKRGAWLARKLIAEPPDDPPPNVPKLPEDDDQQLTLREKLEKHRDQKGCAKCHAGIDPWGLPLEEFDAGGRFKMDLDVDARSILPDKTKIHDANSLKDYLATERINQVAFSFMKHLATYATGRDLDYNEIEFLREAGLELEADGYRMQDLFRFVINSPLFLEK